MPSSCDRKNEPKLKVAFVIAASLADFATPLILAGNQFPVLPTQAYLQITGLFDLKGGAVLSHSDIRLNVFLANLLRFLQHNFLRLPHC
jgi:ABC-type Fe3+ transport system permease subunit